MSPLSTAMPSPPCGCGARDHLVEMCLVGLVHGVGQALPHRLLHPELTDGFGVEPGSGGRLIIVRLRPLIGKGGCVEVHGELLIDLPTGVGDHLSRVAVDPRDAGGLDSDPSLFGDLPDQRGTGRLTDLDPAPGEFPMPIVGSLNKEHLALLVTHHRKRRRPNGLGGRCSRFAEVLSACHVRK